MAHENENSIVGKIEVADLVRTLNRKRTVQGTVTHINKRGIACILGAYYDGAEGLISCKAHVENLALIRKAERGGK